MAAAILFLLLLIAVVRVQHLDGLGGYGSNIGWHWPWTPIIQVCFVGFIYVVLSGAHIRTAAIAEECPPYWQCTPQGDWNHPNCKCWENK